MLFTDEIVLLFACGFDRLELALASLLYLVASFPLGLRYLGPRALGLCVADIIPVVFIFLAVINPVGF